MPSRNRGPIGRRQGAMTTEVVIILPHMTYRTRPAPPWLPLVDTSPFSSKINSDIGGMSVNNKRREGELRPKFKASAMNTIMVREAVVLAGRSSKYVPEMVESSHLPHNFPVRMRQLDPEMMARSSQVSNCADDSSP
jgi:hypothetical protein